MTAKKFELKDFFIKAVNDKPSKLNLKMNGKNSGEWLGVLGSESPRVKRAVYEYQARVKEILKELESIKDPIENAIHDEVEMRDARAKMALVATAEWSFEGATKSDIEDLFNESTLIAENVINYCLYLGSNLQKK